MNPFQYHNRYLGRGNPVGPDEVEVLQTDVMRFIAILCLCLMAIFALVQSLPVAPPDLRPRLEKQMHLPQKERNLEVHIQRLQHEPAKLQSQIDHKKQRPPQAENRKKEPASPAKPVVPSAPEPVKQGFSLRFSSEEALNRLIKGEKVNCFAFTGKKTWRLTIENGRPGLIPSPKPASFYEMDPLTVPTTYKSTLAKAVAAFGPSAVTWGVTLPDSTRSGIALLMKEKKGGELVIDDAGGVELEG